MSTTPPEVLRLIAKNAQKQEKVLNLIGYELTEIPVEVLQLQHLEGLDVCDNKIKKLPRELQQLPKLQWIDARENPLDEIADIAGLILDGKVYEHHQESLSPENIVGLRLKLQQGEELPDYLFELPNLSSLYLGGNQLETLPENISQLVNLSSLDLSWNHRLETLPESISQLVHLSSLDLSWNRLTTLPESISQLVHFSSLDLSVNQLTTLPESIFQLVHLSSLDLGMNQLTTLPESISQLAHLSSLDLSGNHLTTLPESISQLVHLSSLDLSANQLTTLPESISQLVHLSSLDLSANQLTTLPESISQLVKLSSLDLGGNHLTMLPESISQLAHLSSLDLRHNQLTTLPESISQLVHLSSLSLVSNLFSEIPPVIYKLNGLRKLRLHNTFMYGSRNRIQFVSRDFLQLTQLEELDLSGNPIHHPPMEVVAQGIQAIREYFAELNKGAIKNTQAKLILVGNGRVGKTCIVKRLAGELYNPDEPSTHGIRIVSLPFTLTDATTLTVNVWDFGGQDIYHATHRLFLTQRAVYLLVFDADTETHPKHDNTTIDYPLSYWLETIKMVGGDSPIIVVQNKIDRYNEPPSDLSALSKEYGLNYDDHYCRVSAAKPTGFDQLKHLIQQQLAAISDIVGYEIPRSWLQVQQAITSQREQGQTILSYESYFAICHNVGLTPDNARVLCRFLHQLAVILHFDPATLPKLDSLVIINPVWATELVYKILDRQKNLHLFEMGGRFDKTFVYTVLNSETDHHLTETEQDELLGLLIKFELCFKSPEKKDEYIAPQFLPLARPTWIGKMVWKYTGHPQLRYSYQKFIPPHTMIRFLSRFGEKAVEREYWRNGILLHQADTYALIESHPAQQTITVSIQGHRNNGLLAKIYKNFKDINGRVKIVEQVPCVCEDCITAPQPHEFTIEELIECSQKHREIQCHNSRKLIDVTILLQGILDTGTGAVQLATPTPDVTEQAKTPISQLTTEESEKPMTEKTQDPNKEMIDPTPLKISFKILQAAIDKVPAVKYALGVAGIAAALALIKLLVNDLRIAFFGVIAMLFLMLVLFLFAKLGETIPKSAKTVLIWFSVVLFMAVCLALFSSVFFNYPLPLSSMMITNRI